MTITINGTTGISGVDGSAGTPAVQGTDTNTGVFYPAADTVAVSTGGSERMRVDSSGNVGIGTSSPGSILDVQSATSIIRNTATTGTNQVAIRQGNTGGYFYTGIDTSTGGYLTGAAYAGFHWMSGAYPMIFATNNSERMRIDSSGNLLVGTTSNPTTNRINISWDNANYGGMRFSPSSSTYNQSAIEFYNNGTTRVGYIYTTGSATTYSTSSDYRLKHDIQPMTGALAKVAQLKPVTYKWNADDSESQGFIAHELQTVVPECVTGEKDAIDADGNPVYQGIDTSFLVATLTAAIKEQQSLIISMREELDALKTKVGA